MNLQQLPLELSGVLNALAKDYFLGKDDIIEFSRGSSSDEEIAEMFDSQSFKMTDRAILANELERQYQHLRIDQKVGSNLQLLKEGTSFTVTTGHQLCLFTGPSYFIYKIISVIAECNRLKNKFPEYHFIPVYWMATEDHDREEINHTYLYGKKITWDTNQSGRVGEFKLSGLDEVLQSFLGILGDTHLSNYLRGIFEDALRNCDDLSSFTRFYLNELFGKYGLLVLDGNTTSLKTQFKNEISRELFQQIGFKTVNQRTSKLQSLGYKPQINPREINLFFCESGLRERIVHENNRFVINNTSLSFSFEEMSKILEEFPEKFSPNVVLRPLYQQKILPNVIYCGGPAELSYWLQLKNYFLEFGIEFPVLKFRMFFVIMDQVHLNRWSDFGFSLKDFFLEDELLKKMWVKNKYEDVELVSQKEKIQQLFDEIKRMVARIDTTLEGTVESERQKSLVSMNTLEKKINRSLANKNEVLLSQIVKTKQKVMPSGVFQERYENFFALVNKYGIELIDELILMDENRLLNKNLNFIGI